MYESKAAGRDTFRCYSAEMNARATAKSDIENALKLAQVRGEFVLHYQPKMQIDSGKWTSVEALIRWNRPGHGLVRAQCLHPRPGRDGPDRSGRRLGHRRGLPADPGMGTRRVWARFRSR